MRKLALVCLALGGLGFTATGCTSVGPGQFDVAWNLTPGCGTLGVTAEVTAQRAGGQTYIDLFDCSAGIGLTDPVPAGNYTVWVNILDASNNLVAQSFAVDVGLNDNQVVPLTFNILRDEAYIAASWEIVESGTDAPLSCAEVGADGVSILATLVGPNTATEDIFDCDNGADMTDPLPLGDYEVIVYLLDDEEVLGDSNPRSVALDWGNQVEDLGHFIFEYD
jgi:hypothetical protein